MFIGTKLSLDEIKGNTIKNMEREVGVTLWPVSVSYLSYYADRVIASTAFFCIKVLNHRITTNLLKMASYLQVRM